MANINKLLNKKSWTGKEVGKAYIASLVHDIVNAGNPDNKPLFSQNEFERMAKSLKDRYEIRQYKIYMTLCSGVLDLFTAKEAMRQQFYHGFYRNFVTIQNVINAETTLEVLSFPPLILKQEKYDEYKRDTENYWRNGEVSYEELVDSIVYTYKELPKGTPKDLKKALTKLKEEPLDNPRVIKEYRIAQGYGHYETTDGIKSNELSSEEWVRKLEEDFIKNHPELEDEINKLGLKEVRGNRNLEMKSIQRKWVFKEFDKDKIIRDYHDKTGQNLSDWSLNRLEEIFITYVTDGYYTQHDKDYLTTTYQHEEEERTLLEMLPQYNQYSNELKWVEDELDLSQANKLDILENGSLEYYYENFEEFKNDYTELYQVIKQYLYELLPDLNENTVYSRGELADAGIAFFKDLIEPDPIKIREYLLNETDIQPFGDIVISQGAFLGVSSSSDPEAYLNLGNKMAGIIGDIHSLYDNKENTTTYKEDANALIIPALKFIYAYNAFIDILASTFDVDVLRGLAHTEKSIETKVNALDELVYYAYSKFTGTSQEKAEKRRKFKELFTDIEIEKMYPTEEAILNMTKKMFNLASDINADDELSNMRGFIEELLNHDTLEGE